MDQVQESYDEFNLNFRIEDTVIVNQTEMEGFNAFSLKPVHLSAECCRGRACSVLQDSCNVAARSVLEEAVVQGRVSFDLVEYIESVVVF